MRPKIPILIALCSALTACSAASDDAAPEPNLPHVASAELQREVVAGPSLRCGVAAGTLSCQVATAPGFRVEMASVLVQTPDRLDEVMFQGDVEVGALVDAPQLIAELDGATDLDIQLHFVADSIAAPDGITTTDAAVRCVAHTSGADVDDIVCEAGDFERWNVYLVPDAELVDAWERGDFGTASVQTTIVSEAEGSGVCFREYPRCEPEGLSERWSPVLDDVGTIPDALEYAFMMPREAASSSVSVTTNISFDPAPLPGPGIYVLGADGALVAH